MNINTFAVSTLLLTTLAVSASTNAMTPFRLKRDANVTSAFDGPEVKGGTVTYSVDNGKNTLTLSSDFVAPKAPSVHWQVVDSDNDVFTLQRLDVKGGKVNRSIVLPKYIHNVVSVRMYCTFAEVTLGEAKFSAPISTVDGGKR